MRKRAYLNMAAMVMVLLSGFAGMILISPVSRGATAYAVSITVPVASKTISPGTSTQYTYTITNEGTNADRYTVNITYDQVYRNKGWTATITLVSTSLISSGNSAAGTLIVTAPSNASVSDQFTVMIRVTSQTDPTNSTASTYTVTGITPRYGVSIQTPPPKTVAKGSTVTYRFNVTNTGNSNDIITLRVVSYPSGWVQPQLSYSASQLPPGGKMPVNMTVFVPYTARAQPYSTTIEAVSSGNSSVKAIAVITTNVQQNYNVAVSSEGTKYVDISPGSYVVFNVTVTNIGNGYDRFALSTYVPPQYISQGWNADLSSDNTGSDLAPGESYNTTLVITPPPSSNRPRAGDKMEVWINATSMYDPSTPRATASTKVTALVRQYFSLSLMGLVVTQSVDPGSSATFKFQVKNTGNGEDNIKFSVSDLHGWSAPSINPNSVTLGAGETANITLTIRAPSNALATEPYVFTLWANSTRSSTASDYQLFTANVNQTYRVKIEPQSGYSAVVPDGYPGKFVTFRLRAVNLGNGEDDFDLSVGADDSSLVSTWNPTLDSPSIEQLGPSEGYNFTVTMFVPFNATTGNYNFYVNCSSRSDPSKYFRLPLIVQIPQLYNVEITSNADNLAAGYSTVANPVKVKFNITVYNRGSGKDVITIGVDSAPDEFSGLYSLYFADNSARSIEMNSGEMKTAYLEVTMPTTTSGVEAKTYTFRVYARSDNGTPYVNSDDVIRNLNLYLKLKPFHAVSVYTGTNSSQIKIGSSIVYDVIVKNMGTENDTFQLTKIHQDYGDKIKFIIPNQNLTTRVLAPGEYEIIPLTVQILTGADPRLGSVMVTVKATSTSDPNVYDTETFITTIADDFAGDLFSQDTYEEASPGNYAVFNVTLKNLGTRQVDYFYVKADEGSPFDNIVINPPTLTLTPNQERTVQVKVYVPAIEDTIIPVGTYNVTIRAFSEGQTNTSSQDDVEVDNITLKVRVLQVRKVLLAIPDTYAKLKPNQMKEFTLNVTNKGNGRDDFKIKLVTTSYSTWVQIMTSTVTLDPQKSRNVKVRVTVPDKQAPSIGNRIEFRVFSNSDSRVYDNESITIDVEQIYGVDLFIPGSATSKDVDPGSSVSFRVSVKNTGTGEDTIDIDLTSTANSDWVTFGVYDSDGRTRLPITYMTLSRNSIGYFWVNISVPDDVSGEKTFTFKGVSRGDEDVSDTLVLTVNILPKRGVKLETTEDRKEVTPYLSGSTRAKVTYTLQVRNTGMASDSFNIEVVDELSEHPAWVTLSTTHTQTLSPNGVQTITVTIEVPNKEAPGEFKTVIRATSPAEKPGQEDVTHDLTIYTEVKQAYGVNLVSSVDWVSTSDTVQEGQNYREVKFTLRLTNIGTGVDDYKIDWGKQLQSYSDWKVSYPSEVLGVNSSESVTVYFTVQVPVDAKVGTYSFTVWAVSRGDDDEYDKNVDATSKTLTLTVEVTQLYGVELEASTEEISAAPGSSVTFKVTVKNLGNGPDSFELSVDDKYDWATLSKTKVSLAEFGSTSGTDSTEIDVKVTISSDYTKALAGPYTILVKAQRSGKTAAERNKATDEITLTVNIDEVREVRISAPDTSLKAEPGKSATYEIRIKNMGNSVDTYRLEVKGTKKEWASLDKEYITVRPGESSYVIANVTITVPSLTSVRDPDDVRAGPYDFTVEAVSRSDESVKDSETLTLTVETARRVVVEKITEEEPVVVNSNEETRIKFRVRNMGNSEDTIRITPPTFPPAGMDISVSPSSRSLDVGDEVEVTATITFTSQPTAGTYTIKIKVTPDSGRDRDNQVTVTFTVDVRVPNLYVDKSNVTFSKRNPAPGETVLITVEIYNKGTADAKDVRVALKIDGKELPQAKTVSVKAGESTKVEFEWKATEGSHKIEVAVNERKSLKETTYDDNTVTSVMSVEKVYLPSTLATYLVIVLVVILILLALLAYFAVKSKDMRIRELMEELEGRGGPGAGAGAL
ncbi:MAG: hypothetical protein J7L88_01035, partial [Thermoplasmata archaeon]|nr:hypothetical protein [Thermoplasmata archaeon]